ncbi:MAG: hypothetical protein IKP91_05660 [Bacteroidaceae bacterium]|nr:hypothetical protein [Bacteroidaceae bacterium]
MKKILFCLSLACMLPLLCACQKDKEDNDAQTPEMKTPELKEKAISLSFKDTTAPYSSIILTETGKAIVAKALPKQSAPSTRGGTLIPEYIYGRYEVTGDVYTIFDNSNNFVCHLQLLKNAEGTITSVKIFLNSNVDEGVAYAVEVIGKVSDSNLTQDLCRNWKISYTHITLDGAVKATKIFEAPDASSFNAIFEYAKEKAPQLDAEIPEKMKITDIMFTQTGSFIILFENGKIFVGTWNWKNEKTGEINYAWDGDEKMFDYESGKATFTIETYKKVSYYTLTLSGSVTDAGKTYNATIAFNLEEK